MRTETRLHHDRIVGQWLLGIAVMVFIMVVLGGLTRLTGSGLSMVDWRPVTGWLPPLNEAQWQAVFELYKQSPQYLKINFGMTLLEFQEIFWLEFFHRLWGRVIGLAFGLPLVFFLIRGWIRKPMIAPLCLLFVLGGAQGVLGWYMVKSGLVHDPEVSQYRLMAHLGFAVVLFGAIIWMALRFLSRNQTGRQTREALKHQGMVLWALAFLTILAGALVAGLDAGLTYNTFPLMDGEIIPRGLGMLSPWYINSFENITTVQFQHRILGISTFCLTLWMYMRYRRTLSGELQKRAMNVCLVLVSLQVILGIITLVQGVPIFPAVLHQATALAFICALTWLNYELRR